MKVLSRWDAYDGFVRVEELGTDIGDRIVIHATDSVAIFIYNETTDEILLISQPRAPMISDENPSGEIVEVVAGRFDKDIALMQLIINEVEEEFGCKIFDHQVVILNRGQPLALSPGILTEKQYLAYVTVTSDQIEKGDGMFGADGEGEEITRKFVPVSFLENMIFQDMKTWALVQWFLKMRLLHKKS